MILLIMESAHRTIPAHNTKTFLFQGPYQIVECDLCSSVLRLDNLVRHRGSRRCKVRCDLCGERVSATFIEEHKDQHVLNLNIDLGQYSQDSTIPTEVGDPDESEEGVKDIYTTFQRFIKTSVRIGKRMSTFNFEVDSVSKVELEHLFKRVFKQQKNAFKINVSLGYILQNKESGEYGFYNSSQNNQLLFEEPKLIRNTGDKISFTDDLRSIDLIKHVSRPTSKWIFVRVTNVTFYVYMLEGVPIGNSKEFPEHLRKNKGLHSLVCCKKTGKPFADSKCFFRCLALHLGSKITGIERPTTSLLKTYCTKASISDFKGVTLDMLEELSRTFNVGINVYSQESNRDTDLIFRSTLREKIMNLNLYDNHFSYIKDMEKYSSSYRCPKCDRFITHAGMFNRHTKTCDVGVKKEYKGGVFELRKTIFEELEEQADIVIPAEMRIFPFRAVYDIECMLTKETSINDTEKTVYSAQHHLASVSVCSNVPGYTQPKCFVIGGGGARQLTKDMVNYLMEISDKSAMLMRERFSGFLPQINELDSLKDKFVKYIEQIPVISYNGAKYDLKVLKQELIPVLVELDSMQFAIKKGGSYMCISTDELKFIDITNFIAPGVDYNSFLKAYDVEQAKSAFPYEWFDNLEKLDQTTFPEYKDFFSSLKQRNVFELPVDKEHNMEICIQMGHQQYTTLKEMFTLNGWTMREFLIYYNNLDTKPFVEAVGNLVKYYEDRGVDLFKEALSVPGIAERLAFQTLKPDENEVFYLFNKYNRDLVELFRSQNVGGPAIIFDRLQHAGVTNIRHNPDGEVCKKIYGFDANALYLGCMAEQMPCGMYVRRKREDNFIKRYPTPVSNVATEWIAHVETKNCVHIQHARNGGEKKIGDRKLPVDGYCRETKTIYQFHGCLFHGCTKCFPDDRDNVGVSFFARSHNDKFTRTTENNEYLRAQGYSVVEKWECDWKAEREPAHKNHKYLYPTESKFRMTEREIIDAIREDKLFGAVQVDIVVPEKLKNYFEEMPPVFKNAIVRHEDIGDHMQAFLEEQQKRFPDTRYLVASMFGKEILLITPLLRWYMEKGLQITRVYQVIEFDPKCCFQTFADQVSNDRRAGDVDKSKKIVGDTSKLTGNSVYGHSLMDKEKHTSVNFCGLDKATKYINNPYFRNIEEMAGETFEVSMQKRKVKFDLPLQLGFFVYQWAKLKMLIFMYDVIDKHVDRRKYCLLEMDTDSLYIALSEDTLDDAIKPEMKDSWRDIKSKVFPREDTPEHFNYDKRTPGLFKTEWSGDSFIGLNAKTYFCSDDKDATQSKYSSKGLNRSLNLTKEEYMKVLETRSSPIHKNRGFIFRNNSVFTYELDKKGLNYLYVKRKVLEDGISTTYLDV